MEAYGEFAAVYDLFMEADYGRILDFVIKAWGKKPVRRVLDLGCGTGDAAIGLCQRGYEVTALDNSPDMLALAREKAGEGPLPLFLLGDMQDFRLGEKLDAVLCLTDSLNYILTKAGVRKVFSNCAKALSPGGMFIFDVNTPYKYKNILACNNFSHITDNAGYIWENYYDERKALNRYMINFFVKEKSGLYRRFTEEHVQRAYDVDFLAAALLETGFVLKGVYGGYAKKPLGENSERAVFVARRL